MRMLFPLSLSFPLALFSIPIAIATGAAVSRTLGVAVSVRTSPAATAAASIAFLLQPISFATSTLARLTLQAIS